MREYIVQVGIVLFMLFFYIRGMREHIRRRDNDRRNY